MKALLVVAITTAVVLALVFLGSIAVSLHTLASPPA